MQLFFILIALLCLTIFRPLLLLLYPVIVLLTFIRLNLRLNSRAMLALLIIVVISAISSFIEGFYLPNLLIALYMLIPTLVLIFSKPKPMEIKENPEYLKKFISIFCKILVLINISALIYAVIVVSSSAYPEDIFTGFYGSGGFGSHSLSVINLMVAAYFFFEKKYMFFSFYFLCGIAGFYGLGLIIFFGALGLVLLPIFLKNMVKFIKIIVAILVFVIILFSFKLGNYDYIKVNIEYAQMIFDDYSYKEEIQKMKRHERTFVPRYLTFLDGSGSLLFSDAKVFFLGTSPGTYNSRTAFYLNGDFIGNEFVRENVEFKTKYHERYVFPILNKEYLANTRWNDGTRNQPFSSVVALLLEYGFFIGGFILFYMFYKFRRISRGAINKKRKNFLLFLMFYTFLLCLLQYYLEVIEIILPVILLFKLSEVDQANMNYEATANS